MTVVESIQFFILRASASASARICCLSALMIVHENNLYGPAISHCRLSNQIICISHRSVDPRLAKSTYLVERWHDADRCPSRPGDAFDLSLKARWFFPMSHLLGQKNCDPMRRCAISSVARCEDNHRLRWTLTMKTMTRDRLRATPTFGDSVKRVCG